MQKTAADYCTIKIKVVLLQAVSVRKLVSDICSDVVKA